LNCLSEDQKRVLNLFTKNGLKIGYAYQCVKALKIGSPLNALKDLKDKGLIEVGKDSNKNVVIRRTDLQ